MADSLITVAVSLDDDRVRFNAPLTNNPAVEVDALPPVGHGEGAAPLELLLASFAACTGMTVASLIRDRMRKDLRGMRVEAEGVLRDEHPKAFTRIDAKLIIESPDLTDAEAQRALDSAERKVCPVWAMLRGNVDMNAEFEIIR